MKTFLSPILFLLVGLAGAAMIVLAANRNAAQRVPGWLSGTHRTVHAMPVIGDIAKSLRAALVRTAPSPAEQQPLRSHTEAKGTASKSGPIMPKASTTLSTKSVASVATRPAPLSIPEKKTARTPTRQTSDDVSKGEWALVASHGARIYDVAGKNLGVAKIGLLAIVKRRAQSGKREMLVCNGVANARPFVLAREDVIIYAGSPDALSAEHRSLLVKLASLTADRTQRQAQLERGVRDDNPHAAAFAAAKSAYVQYWKKAKKLEKQRTEAEGAQRVEYVSELRKMKGADIAIGNAYEAAKQKYEAWNTAHPNGPSDSETTRLDRALANVQGQLDALQP